MKATILHVENNPNKKTGEINYAMTILSKFSSYGAVRPASAQVKLDASSFEKYKGMVGKEVDIEVIMPLPDFPLQLA